MAKGIVFDIEARRKMLAGISALADTVRITLGPQGRYVALEKADTAPLLTNDGVTIAKEIEFEDSFETMGANVIKEVASKANDRAGDGTTTAILLAHHMVSEGFRLTATGVNPIALKHGILGASQLAGAALQKMAQEVKDHEAIRQVATISAKDKVLGDVVADAFEQVGIDGVITLEDSTDWETRMDAAEGMQFDRGYLSPEMVSDRAKMTAELNHPYILVTDYEISDPQEILPLLNGVAETARPLLIIAESVKGPALGTLIVNKREGVLNVVAVHPPAYGDGRRARMDDLALWTGAVFVTEELGYSLCETTLDMLGSAESVKVDNRSTTIINGGGDQSAVNTRINNLRALIEDTDYDFARQQLKERLARFAGGVAMIRIGGSTEAEIQERRLRCEDALHAARSALSGGIVPGGGVAYLSIKPAIKAYKDSLCGDEARGAGILLSALDQPTYQIAENSGVSGRVVLAKLKQQSGNIGFNAASGTYSDMVAEGIVDPAKVAVTALQSAASAASVLLTTEVGIVTAKTKASPDAVQSNL